MQSDAASFQSNLSEFDALLEHEPSSRPSTSEHQTSRLLRIWQNALVDKATVVSNLMAMRSIILKGLVQRLGTTIVIIALLIAGSIRLQFASHPSEYEDQSVEFNFTTNFTSIQDIEIWDTSFDIADSYRVETHAHSTKSDGNMSPKQLVQWAHAYGFNALFLSDHNNVKGLAEAQAEAHRLNIIIIPALEYTCCRIHMNLVNISDTRGLEPATWPSDSELQRIVRETHDRGGFVVVNHLPWSQNIEYGYDLPTLPDHPDISTLVDWGVDGFESVHDNVIDLRMLRRSERDNLVVIASNDIHYAAQPAYTWTTLSLSSLTQSSVGGAISRDSILHELFIRKQSTFMYSATGASGRAYPPLSESWVGYHLFAPLTTIRFNWLFTERKGMYSFTGEFCHPRQFQLHHQRIIWFLIWCVLAFAMYEVARSVIIYVSRTATRKPQEGHERYRLD